MPGQNANKRELQLVGVRHTNRYIHSVIDKLKKRVKPNMVVGVELSPKSLPFIMGHIKKKWRPFDPDVVFWFNVINFLLKNKAKIVPIDTAFDEIAKKSTGMMLKAVIKKMVLSQERDVAIAKEITDKEIELAIVGSAHLPQIYKHFKRKGWIVRATQIKNPLWQIKRNIREKYHIPKPKTRLKSGALRRA